MFPSWAGDEQGQGPGLLTAGARVLLFTQSCCQHRCSHRPDTLLHISSDTIPLFLGGAGGAVVLSWSDWLCVCLAFCLFMISIGRATVKAAVHHEPGAPRRRCLLHCRNAVFIGRSSASLCFVLLGCIPVVDKSNWWQCRTRHVFVYITTRSRRGLVNVIWFQQQRIAWRFYSLWCGTFSSARSLTS